jgi:4-hydroxybenzoate polyprenyltransferase
LLFAGFLLCYRIMLLFTRIEPTPYWRTLLILGRVSNLPTVWSNCLAGWLLGGGGTGWILVVICLGATCLYVGGMFLNDAFDVEFDREYRRERPIPSQQITLEEVWRWAFGWLGAGTVILVLLGKSTGLFAVMLLVCIILYDAIHKVIGLSPVLMSACRFLLYIVAASQARQGVTGLAIWSGLALAAYIIGLTYLARHESTGGTLNFWPLCLLAAPNLLALLANAEGYRRAAYLLSAILGLWIARCLRHVFLAPDPNPGRSVAGLLAGIVLVDWLAVDGGQTIWTGFAFALLFVTALIFQRFVPAT